MPIDMNEANHLIEQILSEVEKAIVGKRETLKKILAAFLTSGGHVLLEDYPGLAKTLTASSFASALGLTFKRIQFTPDLLPGDITGGYIYDRLNNRFNLRQGPVFANIILADEINRASPRTQSALLEAMQEFQVTLEGETLPLPEPFIVIAPQNPIEYDGTFPLPEAQLDRFIMKLSLGYPSIEEEQQILNRRRMRQTDTFQLNAVTDINGLLALRQLTETVHVEPDVEKYIVQIVSSTRQHRHVAVGASPRAALALLKLSRAWAVMQGRTYVLPDDVKLFAAPVLIHRLILQPDFWSNRNAVKMVIEETLNTIPVPVIQE